MRSFDYVAWVREFTERYRRLPFTKVDGTDEQVFVDTYTVALDRVCLTTLELSTLPRSVPVPYKPKKLSVALTSEGGMANGLRSKPETTRP